MENAWILFLIFGVIIGTFVLQIGLDKRKKDKAQRDEQKQAEDRINNVLQKYKKEEQQQKHIASLRGLEKITYMNNAEIQSKIEGAQALRAFGAAIQGSVYQEKEHDWALWGGIAEGLGGVGAGIATAADTMIENQMIRQRNAQNAEWGRAQNKRMSELADEMEQEAPKYISDYTISSQYKTNYTWSPIKLFEKIYVGTVKIEICNLTGAIRITVYCLIAGKCSCIDGSLRAIVYDENNKCVGCAYINLPKYGITSSATKLTGICTEYRVDVPPLDYYSTPGFVEQIRYSSNLSVKVAPIDLWELVPPNKEKATQAKKWVITEEEHNKIVDELEKDYLSALNSIES